MNNRALYWLNVDIPTKRWVLHCEGCRHAHAKRETLYKGIGQIKRDGGWLHFASSEDAAHYVQQTWQSKAILQ